MPSVALLGATGLVGRHCLDLLSRDASFERVVVIARRAPGEALAPRIEAHVVDMERLDDHFELFRVDQVICALGTTIRAVQGSRERFRAVDYGIPLSAARIAHRQGVHHFLLVSALSANAKSRVFYSRVKGELEDELRTIGFRSVTILRPSLLLGERREFRLGERLAKSVAWAMPGRWRPVEARDVALTIVRAAREDRPGFHVIESGAIAAVGEAHGP